MSPLDMIVTEARAEQQRNAIHDAAYQFIGNITRLYEQVGFHIDANAALANQYGMTSLMAELPAEVSANAAGFLGALKTMWEQLTGNPFPDMPNDPVPPPTPDPVPDGGG